MHHRIGGFVKRRRYGFGGGSGGAVPSIALQLIGSDYHVFSSNVDTPDAYFNLSGGNVYLQTGVSSGLSIVNNGDNTVQLTNP